jgi:site-specific DNA recombinase
VLVYRLDRLGRSLKSLLDAHHTLEKAGVTIRSATEPFDTATPIGRFVFQLLGSLAELERSTILERTVMGRDHAARQGKWTGGVVPRGYDVDEDGYLKLSDRTVENSPILEADFVREIFLRIANGSTTVAEARRLNTLGIPAGRRYSDGKFHPPPGLWRPNHINGMVRNPIYRGTHILKAKGGSIARSVPALLDEDLWERANSRLTKNRSFPVRTYKHPYLLRGLVRCVACGASYVGTGISSARNGHVWVGRYYRCGSQLSSLRPDPNKRCPAKMLAADEIERIVWEDCRAYVHDPGKALEDAWQQFQTRQSQSEQTTEEQSRLTAAMQEKATERERVLMLYQRGHLPLEETETRLSAITDGIEQLRTMLSAIEAQENNLEAWKAKLSGAEVLLTQLRERIDKIEETEDWSGKQEIMSLLVHEVRVETSGEGRMKQATARITYAFEEQKARHAVVTGMDRHERSRDRGLGST